MKTKTAMIAILLVFFIAASALAAGGEPFAFLKLGAGTRATGMGGAFVSVANDASAIFYNPAGTTLLTALELTGEMYFLSMGRSLNYIATGKAFDVSKNTFSLGIAWMNYSAGSDIERRSTNTPAYTSTFSDGSNIFIFNGGARLGDRVSLGLNVKYLLESIDTSQGTGFGFDLGGLVNITEGFNAGIAISNIATSVSWTTVSHTDSLPQNITAGLSYFYKDMFSAKGMNLLSAADLYYLTTGSLKARVGVEFNSNDFFFIRLGYNNTFTAGAGLKLKPSEAFSVKIDYAYMPDQIEPGASNHRIAVSMAYVFPVSKIGQYNSWNSGVSTAPGGTRGTRSTSPGLGYENIDTIGNTQAGQGTINQETGERMIPIYDHPVEAPTAAATATTKGTAGKAGKPAATPAPTPVEESHEGMIKVYDDNYGGPKDNGNNGRQRDEFDW